MLGCARRCPPSSQEGVRGRSRGVTLIELTVAVGLGLTILSFGYAAYSRIARADDHESKRHAAMLTVQNLMARIKQDVRAGRALSAAGDTLAISGERQITYRSVPGGVERQVGRGRALYRGASARFEERSSGVSISLRYEAKAHRRPIRVEISTFVSPRNR